MDTKEIILSWLNQFENDHYEFDVYGENVTVDLPRDIVEKVLDLSIMLVDRVSLAKDELTTVEYETLEQELREKYPKDSEWLFHIILKVTVDDHLYGRYRDIERSIRQLIPRGHPFGSASDLIVTRPYIQELIYAVIRHVDDIEENYESLAYTFFIGILAKCWGEGYG